MWFEDFKMATILASLNTDGMILAILNLYVAPIPPIKFHAQSDLQIGRRCRLKIFKMVDMATISDIRMEWF